MVLPADKRINLTSSHRLGLTNEGDYSVVDVNIDGKITNILKDILFDEGTGKYLYPEVGDTLDILPFVLPMLYSMGIHSLCKFDKDSKVAISFRGYLQQVYIKKQLWLVKRFNLPN